MNNLPREKQIEIIAALCEGVGQRAVTRLTGTDRKTVARLALRVGRGCAELHDRMMVGIRVQRLELDEAWSFVGKKQKNVKRNELFAKGDQYVFIGMAGTQKAIISYRVGKRDTDNTAEFIYDLRERVIGLPEISTDGFLPYKNAIRDAFGNRIAHGTITKTYSVTNLGKQAAVRYSPAQVVAVARDVVSGLPVEISTSYVERQNLTLRMGSRRFTRLTNGFSKSLDCHVAAVSLHVAFYNLCRSHEALRTTPAVSIGITDHAWSIGELIDAALAQVSPDLGRRRKKPTLTVVEGGKSDP
jgi:IS1 family transposase